MNTIQQCRELDSRPTIEICTNYEWIRNCVDFDTEGTPYTDKELSRIYFDPVVEFLEGHGLESGRAKNQRILFHGWNGARFDYRVGGIGAWGYVPERIKELMHAAHELGCGAINNLLEVAAS